MRYLSQSAEMPLYRVRKMNYNAVKAEMGNYFKGRSYFYPC